MKTIPTKINNYNVYNAGNRLLGMGEELTLPDFEASTETISGAGVLGEFDDPNIGYFSNQEIEIPFRVLDGEAVDMLDMTKAVQLEIRGAQQTTNSEGDIEPRQMRVVVRGRAKKFSPGKVKKGNPMDTSVTLTVLYILIELEGSPVLELDKLNEVFKINGTDVLAEIKEMC
ncbi:MAG: phage major tail tube protein [Intestinimonas sp.]|jgi:P2 family phage contractile tail tube protein|nr:phage major tail tube protein [Intestinimonas sp.]